MKDSAQGLNKSEGFQLFQDSFWLIFAIVLGKLHYENIVLPSCFWVKGF